MATSTVAVTSAWTDIKTSLSLEEGSIYTIDGVIGGTTYMRESSSEPTGTIGHPIDRGESRVVTITSEKLWVRSDGPNTKIVLTLEA